MKIHRMRGALSGIVATILAAAPAVAQAETNDTSSAPPPPATTEPDDWRADVTANCDRTVGELTAIVFPDRETASAAAVVDFVAAHRAARERLELNVLPELPAELHAEADAIAFRIDAAEAALTVAEEAAATGDVDAALTAMEAYIAHLLAIGALYAVAGAQCGSADPVRAAGASLNVLLEFSPLNITSGFGSIWVTEFRGRRVARVDPTTGEVLATIDVGVEPIKLQPADGRMWGRTTDAYFAIDPATNSVTATLLKADVGRAADRAWAVDGGLWICDGQRLHRYDTTTLRPVTVLELGITCDLPGGTAELIVASTFNDDDGESGTSAAAFIDPANNRILATIDLPVDVNIGIVLENAVFFPGQQGAQAVVVDRSTWTVTATPDLGRLTAPGTAETDGHSIFVPTADKLDVLVVDASTFTVTDTIEPLAVRSVTIADGSLWVSDHDPGLLQRFDLVE